MDIKVFSHTSTTDHDHYWSAINALDTVIESIVLRTINVNITHRDVKFLSNCVEAEFQFDYTDMNSHKCEVSFNMDDACTVFKSEMTKNGIILEAIDVRIDSAEYPETLTDSLMNMTSVEGVLVDRIGQIDAILDMV